uniref:Uncharacterized protein n=1 Tax=Acrobeloides nanus TaxID=290746 RepID=A0A914ELV7_9BILA
MISLVFVTLCAHVAFGSYPRPGNYDSNGMDQAYGGYGSGGYYGGGTFNQPPRWSEQNVYVQGGSVDGESGFQPGRGGQFSGRGYGQTNQGSGYGQTNQGSGYGQTNQGSGYGQTNQGSGYGQTNQGSGYGQPNQESGYGQPNQGSGWGQSNQGSGWNSQPGQGIFGSNAGFHGLGLGAQDNFGVRTSNTNFGQSSGNFGGSASGVDSHQSPPLGGISNTGFSSASGTVDTSGQQTFTIAPAQVSVGNNFGTPNTTGNSVLENNPIPVTNPSISGRPDPDSNSNTPAPPSVDEQ